MTAALPWVMVLVVLCVAARLVLGAVNAHTTAWRRQERQVLRCMIRGVQDVEGRESLQLYLATVQLQKRRPTRWWRRA